MAVVTLTGHLGSMGNVASEVAARLGYALADRELLLEAAQALGWSEDEVAAFDERTRGQGGRLSRFLGDWAEYASIGGLSATDMGVLAANTYADASVVAEMRPRDQQYIAVLSELVRALANRGNAVIVGRGGQALLAGRDDTLHVRVVCDLDERVKRIATRDGMTVDAARTRVEDSDRQRAAWHRKYLGMDYESPYLYHMVLNVSRLSDSLAADLVVQLVNARLPREEPRAGVPPTPRTRQDWGWIELVDRESGDVRARAHLFATDITPDGAWRGELDSIHLGAREPALQPASYFARFALSGTDHTVSLEVVDGETTVHSTDVEVPAIFSERSGG
jgi:cytidylate kinase